MSPQALSSVTEYLVLRGYSQANDLDTFYRLKHMFTTRLKVELYDLSMFNTLSLHLAYKEFVAKLDSE